MFTGIIEAQASIMNIHQGIFTIENCFLDDIFLWESIAHDGACMTITEIWTQSKHKNKPYYKFFAMEETLRITNLWSKKDGDIFNVERAMIYGKRVDGHMVSGHIDTIAEVNDISKNLDNSRNFTIKLNSKWCNYVIQKGSIAINGISLTIVNIEQYIKNTFLLTVYIIPYTRENTNLSRCHIWDYINIEFDMMGKYILQKISNNKEALQNNQSSVNYSW